MFFPPQNKVSLEHSHRDMSVFHGSFIRMFHVVRWFGKQSLPPKTERRAPNLLFRSWRELLPFFNRKKIKATRLFFFFFQCSDYTRVAHPCKERLPLSPSILASFSLRVREELFSTCPLLIVFLPPTSAPFFFWDPPPLPNPPSIGAPGMSPFSHRCRQAFWRPPS